MPDKLSIAISKSSSDPIYHLEVEEEHNWKYSQAISSSNNLLQSITLETQAEICLFSFRTR